MRTVKMYEGCKREDFEPRHVVAIVKYVQNLDTWDGRNFSSGSAGQHIGIRKITRGVFAGKWYVCYGTDWQGQEDEAFLLEDEEDAKQICLDYDPDSYESLFGEKLEVY